MSAGAVSAPGRRRDLAAGLLCLALGLGALAEARGYTIGSVRQLGPGFYPAVLGSLLAFVGMLITGTAMLGGVADEPEEALPDRPDWRGWACITGGVVLFVVLAWLAGLAPAIFGCAFVAALGDRTATLRGSLVLALVMSAAGTVLFGWLLGINMPLCQLSALR